MLLLRRSISTSLRTHAAFNAFAQLNSRALLQVSGIDASKFLQGIITNHMTKLEAGGDGFLCGFLSANGRVLFDAFVYAQNQHVFTSPASPSPSPSSPYNPTYIIDHHKDISSQLQSHLKRFTLRSKVSISDVSSDYNVYQLWGPGTDALWGQFIPQINVKLPTGSLVPREGFTDIGFRDTRAPGMGVRVVLPQSKSLPALVGSSFIQVEESDYECKRILTGIPEGPKDFISGSSLPLESNLDIMNGVDFRKGCYLGQELTIRTYHRGVTRKRILPITFTTDSCPPHLTDVFYSGKSAGRILSTRALPNSTKHIGLALLRLEHATHPLAAKCIVNGQPMEIEVLAQFPSWWPRQVEASEE